MILYNITYGIDITIEDEWVQWMRDTYIPLILSTQLFTGHRFYKVLSHDEPESASYCVQYFTPSIEQFNRYLEQHASTFQTLLHERYKNKHVAFNTLLEEVA